MNFEARTLAVGLLLGVIIGGLATVVIIPERIVTVTVTLKETEKVASVTTSTVTTTVTSGPPSPPPPPDTKWLDLAQEVISYLDAKNYVGQIKTVEGKIVDTYRDPGSNTVFLNFHDPYEGYFTIVIFSKHLRNFDFKPEDFYLNKEVRVTGLIELWKGSPEIVAEGPSQIEVANMGFNYP